MQYLANVTTLVLNTDKCTGCGMCRIVCPHRVFDIKNGKALITDKDKCMECGACLKNCLEEAIYVRPGVGCAWAIMMSKFRKNKQISCDCGDGECCN